MKRILIVEDEVHLARGLTFNLEQEGFLASVAETAEAALDIMREQPSDYHALIVDVMLPGIDGFEMVRRLRSTGCLLPVMMLTARRRPADIVEGLSSGADDYLPKPFDLTVLMARLRGLLRRQQWSETGQSSAVGERYEFAGRIVDFAQQRLQVGDETRNLTLTESRLLHYLVANEGRTVSRKSLLEDVWGLREDTDTRAIDNFIVRLRRMIETNPSKPRHLVTVRGLGYRFIAEPEPMLSRRLSGAAARRFLRP